MPRSSKKYRSSRRRVVRRAKKGSKNQARTGVVAKGRTPKLYAPATSKVSLSSAQFLGNGFPLPAMYNTTHRYCINQIMSSKTTGLVSQDFYIRLNDLYAPSVGTGAHQPYGYDQMRNFYVNCVVWKVDIQISIIYSTNRSNGLVVYFKRNSNNLTVENLTLDVCKELPNSMVMQPGTGDMEYQTFETSIYIADVAGEKRETILMDDVFSSKGNASPSANQVCSMGLAVGDWNLNGDQNIRFNVTMTYHTRWSVLANPGPS